MKAKDFVFEDETLVKYTGNGGDIIIPDGTVQIGNGWQWDTNFRDLKDINSISIPDSVERICDGAFRFTKALKKIEIPKSVKEIGRSAFWHCDNLSEVYIYGDDIKAYGKVFEDCSALTKIVAPNLPLNTFSEPEVKLIMLRGYLEESDKYDEAIANQYIKYLISQRKKLVPELMKEDCLKAIRILADKKKIDASNFENEYFSPASASNAVQCVAFLLEWKNQNITYDASMDLGDLEIMEKPITLTELKKLWSFDEIETDSIILTDYKGEEENVVIPKRIGNKTVVGLGDYIFSSDKPKRATKRKTYFASGIKSIVVPDGVIEIGKGAFFNCEGIQKIELPNSVNKIGAEAFKGCEQLANSDGLIIVRDVLYGYSKQLIKETVNIPSEVTVIGSRAFEECSIIKKVMISEGVQFIGPYSFSECVSLQEVDIPTSVCEIAAGAFFHCKCLEKVNLPDTITKVPNSAFMKCIKLKRIVIPKNVAEIDVWAFNQCNKLEEVVIECDDTEIGTWAFDNCAKICILVKKESATLERIKEAGVPYKVIE